MSEITADRETLGRVIDDMFEALGVTDNDAALVEIDRLKGIGHDAPSGTTPGNPWQTVPLPATADMIAAGEALDKAMRDQGFANAEPDAIYMAMLDAAPLPPQSAPMAWKYELAHARTWENGEPFGWSDWHWYLTDVKPNVPDGSVRNLKPLYDRPEPPRSAASAVEPVAESYAYVQFSGPAVDALNNRKESDNGPSEDQVTRDARAFLDRAAPTTSPEPNAIAKRLREMCGGATWFDPHTGARQGTAYQLAADEIDRLAARVASPEPDAVREALALMVAAWDSLPVGSHDPREVNNWLCSDAWKKAVTASRAALSAPVSGEALTSHKDNT